MTQNKDSKYNNCIKIPDGSNDISNGATSSDNMNLNDFKEFIQHLEQSEGNGNQASEKLAQSKEVKTYI